MRLNIVHLFKLQNITYYMYMYNNLYFIYLYHWIFTYQDRKYLSIEKAREKKLSIDWLSAPPGMRRHASTLNLLDFIYFI